MRTDVSDSTAGGWVPNRDEVNALQEAIDDEYKEISTYEAAIADVGPIRPGATFWVDP